MCLWFDRQTCSDLVGHENKSSSLYLGQEEILVDQNLKVYIPNIKSSGGAGVCPPLLIRQSPSPCMQTRSPWIRTQALHADPLQTCVKTFPCPKLRLRAVITWARHADLLFINLHWRMNYIFSTRGLPTNRCLQWTYWTCVPKNLSDSTHLLTG